MKTEYSKIKTEYETIRNNKMLDAENVLKSKEEISKLNTEIEAQKDIARERCYEIDVLDRERAALENQLKDKKNSLESYRAEVTKLKHRIVKSPQRLKEVSTFERIRSRN